ncbi:hypothetical protein LY76DRAFT_588979 [Colletotrichum caudatum]|nr:hypothetical protein LY76DRAFT_588979 [Colletotrichum caudatum]
MPSWAHSIQPAPLPLPLMGAAMHGQGRSPRAYQRLIARAVGVRACLSFASCAGRHTEDEVTWFGGSMNALAQMIIGDLASACCS